MKIVIDYLNSQLTDLEVLRSEKETIMNRKVIEANEIHKTVSKLNFDDNNTYNIFSASGSRIEFQNREIIELKAQEDLLRTEADEISNEIKNINFKIEDLIVALAHANSNSKKLDNLTNEVIRLNGEVAMYSTGGKKAKNLSKQNEELELKDNIIVSDENNQENKVNSNTSESCSDENTTVDNMQNYSDEDKNEDKSILSKNLEIIDINMNSNKFLEEIADRLYFVSRILKFDPIRVRLELDEIYKAIIKFINK